LTDATGGFLLLMGLITPAYLSYGLEVFAPRVLHSATFQPTIPTGLSLEAWSNRIPADNPMGEGKVALGRSLFFDRRLSADGRVSCATCHDPATALADRHPMAVGVHDKTGTRNAPTVFNAMFHDRLFWDGRAASLEEQAKAPLINPAEMGMGTYEVVVERVASIPAYPPQFYRVFGRVGITIETIAQAIAAFERTQLSGDSPFDRFMASDPQAITENQKRGWDLFRGKAGCITCHVFQPAAPFFTDFQFHNTGISVRGPIHTLDSIRLNTPNRSDPATGPLSNSQDLSRSFADLGRYVVSRHPKDLGAFKTPTLRDVELTAPYMHDGSIKTLLDVVRFYNQGGRAHPNLDKDIRPLHLTGQEMSNLVEFLRALTSDNVLRQVRTAQPQSRRQENN